MKKLTIGIDVHKAESTAKNVDESLFLSSATTCSVVHAWEKVTLMETNALPQSTASGML
jgi:hypothetical protein